MQTEDCRLSSKCTLAKKLLFFVRNGVTFDLISYLLSLSNLTMKSPMCRTYNTYVYKLYYYSFKIFPRFGLVETTRIIHHNQLLFTKFGKNLRHIQSMTSKVEPATNYSTVDVKMTSKVEPAADIQPLTEKPGDEIVILVTKTKSETAKFH